MLIISKDYFFGVAEAGAGARAAGRLSVIIKDKLPTLRVRFGFCLFITCVFYFITKNIGMC